MKHLLSIKDLSAQEVNDIFKLTTELKEKKTKFKEMLCGKTLGLIFQKPSNRTRVSFQVGMFELGGHSIYLSPGEINLGVRESVKDVAKTLSRYLQGVVLRVFSHNDILEFAKYSTIPVINGLSDLTHPCQGLADVFTIKEKLGVVKNKTLVYVGDGNNVCHSLIYGCAKSGLNLSIATPKGYEPDKFVIRDGFELFKKSNTKLLIVNDPKLAVKNADVVYTDVWTSMGQEKESRVRKQIFKDYQLNKKLIGLAKDKCLIMHCLPAHRGDEITDEVIDSRSSVVFDQAENRLHVQKAILIKLLKGN